PLIRPPQPSTLFPYTTLFRSLQPIVVRETGAQKYELVMGERRWRAAQAMGQRVIPAIIRDTRDDAMLRDALLENIHRANLNPLEDRKSTRLNSSHSQISYAVF